MIPCELLPDEHTHIEVCDDCGGPVLFPNQIMPGEQVATCLNCGTCYADASEEENDVLGQGDS